MANLTLLRSTVEVWDRIYLIRSAASGRPLTSNLRTGKLLVGFSSPQAAESWLVANPQDIEVKVSESSLSHWALPAVDTGSAGLAYMLMDEQLFDVQAAYAAGSRTPSTYERRIAA